MTHLQPALDEMCAASDVTQPINTTGAVHIGSVIYVPLAELSKATTALALAEKRERALREELTAMVARADADRWDLVFDGHAQDLDSAKRLLREGTALAAAREAMEPI